MHQRFIGFIKMLHRHELLSLPLYIRVVFRSRFVNSLPKEAIIVISTTNEEWDVAPAECEPTINRLYLRIKMINQSGTCLISVELHRAPHILVIVH